MSQIVTATYENGVLKPAEPLALPANAKVRLTVDLIIEEPKLTPAQRLAAIEELWRTSTLHSDGERLTRDQLHERR
jgi:predicted DNA-binding antitoxin AbrB/MazE fold protein